MSVTISTTIAIDLSRLKKFRNALSSDLSGASQGPVRQALSQWAARYRGFVQERFDAFSKGGGDWPPLSPATIKARRKGKKPKKGKAAKVAILRDTGTLFAALTPQFVGAPGAVERHVPFGVVVGYGGNASHPNAPLSIAQLAAVHDQGLGNVPQRKILVPPSEHVKSLMIGDMDRALDKLVKE